jgi:hypothetical protein
VADSANHFSALFKAVIGVPELLVPELFLGKDRKKHNSRKRE